MKGITCIKSPRSVSRSVMSHSLQPLGLWLTRVLCPWDSPDKNTGVSCHFLLQGIFLYQGSNPGLLHCRQISYHLSYQGSPASPKEAIIDGVSQTNWAQSPMAGICRTPPLGQALGNAGLNKCLDTPLLCLLPAGLFGKLRHKSSSCVCFCVCPCQSQASVHGELMERVDFRNLPISCSSLLPGVPGV